MRHDRNCLLVWSDSGTPDGQVLLTYFKVAGNRVEFQKEVWALGYRPKRRFFIKTLSVSDLSAAYFDSRYWVAYKTIGASGAGGNPAFISTYAYDLDRWGNKRMIISDHIAAEAPVWLYDPRSPSRETAFVFTEWAG